MQTVKFKQARPVWLTGLSEVMNITAGFRTVFAGGPGTHLLRTAGASIYRIMLNGAFVGHGPARCGHGFYRVDEWRLPVVDGDNLLTIEAAGYNVNSFAYLDQPSFIQAEVESDGSVLAATGSSTFNAYRLKERVQKVQRYSFQRSFVEVYNLAPTSADWCSKPEFDEIPEPLDELAPRRLVPRGVPFPKWETKQPTAVSARGTVEPVQPAEYHTDRSWRGPRPDIKAFPDNDETVYVTRELERLASTIDSRVRVPYNPAEALVLQPNRFQVLDLGTELTGFIGLSVACSEPADLYLTFDELETADGDVDFLRYGCANCVKYTLQPGSYTLETIEPYSFKYLKLLAVHGNCAVTDVYVREYASPDAQKASFAASDRRLAELFEAARQTFRQNAVDIFMDCPGRERAGWLCDSFFTARAERDLCGGNPIEHNFFENYLLPDSYPHLPQGMLPMCYPSDHFDGTFISNWAMWFVVELEEYLRRTGDRDMVDALKPKVYALLDYFKPFLNSDGLLENLDSWIFVEWSKAAEFLRPVNYPTNMLYAGMLETAAELYDDQTLTAQAETVRRVVLEQSFDGEFFVDNAVRGDDGTLQATRNRTETCQYYAFFFNVATPETHPQLWNKLLTEFGPDRDPETEYPDIHPSNAFIGFFLRLDILSRYGQNALVLDQLYKNYLPMAQTTGTLWEHKDTSASCNHGFAAHVAHILYRDILGIRVDPVRKTVEFTVPDLPLDWCAARIPVGDEWIEAKWHRENGSLGHELSVPRGFAVKSGEG